MAALMAQAAADALLADSIHTVAAVLQSADYNARSILNADSV